MPLYEYVCKSCGKHLERLVRGPSDTPVCDCGSRELKKVVSAFAVAGETGNRSSTCSDGTCTLPPSPCASGMCGL